jgi:hypothetical protein
MFLAVIICKTITKLIFCIGLFEVQNATSRKTIFLSNALWNATYYFEGVLPIDIDTNKGMHSVNTFDQVRKLTYLCIRRMLVRIWIFCPFTKFRSIPIFYVLKRGINKLKTIHNYLYDRDNEIDKIQ